jgi:hypothetical protein
MKRTRPGWQVIRPGCEWSYRGWIVQHCGHPTALWPYLGWSPSGEMIVGENGKGFRTLALAQAEVEWREHQDHQRARTCDAPPS